MRELLNFIKKKDYLNFKSTYNEGEIDDNQKNDLFTLACKFGCLDIAKLLFESYEIIIDFKNGEAFKNACFNGNLEIAQWIHSININNKILIRDINNIFIFSCYYGQYEIVEWLLSIGNIDVHHDKESAFRLACCKGHFKIAKMLFINYKINVNAKNSEAFRHASYYGYSEIVNWLLSLNLDNISISALQESFRYACNNGHIDIAKILYSLNKINIHDQDEMAFRFACDSDRLNIVEWLLSLNIIDIHVINDVSFRNAYRENRREIIKLLIDYDNNYFYRYILINNLNKCFDLIDNLIWDKRKFAIISNNLFLFD